MPARSSLHEARLAIEEIAHDLDACRQAGFVTAAEIHLDEAHEALLRAARHIGHAVRCELGAIA